MAQGTARIGKDKYRTQISVGGRDIVADEPPALGGQGAGFAPYDLLLASLGACTAITLRMYADRKGWPMESLEVALRLHGVEEKRIDRTLTIAGLDDEQRARMADIAERTPVTLTLKNGLPIDTRLA
ncbi:MULTISPECIES: OsmC family protein [unclassified Sphingopyxis]|jgi:putative redox protein|uniref:OsmC family protein n=1 Tax=unclassified Sphingopyxis TaxID=2614943 RepID=UPI000730E539|nr:MULTISPECIES: OsmC family protein [unclassified Sphingopyxis]KTE24666.1 osmotically inducible protein C [Sphingopyxis sp. H057]KTE49626.1 osmotically inducible protein C [Sphingopyxis sp. H071]KTE50689.1 osmotically inducible protein C [Sphingopyxis sp. H073]KTE57140.1 osmotically inducible protein C [Sphingopyxis sp. H107]KTE62142.1 osmotically inducible protein C [Sphingopyxis sp. H100]